MAAINGIDITSLLFQEGSAPTTPASTKWRLYFKTDGLYVRDDAGTETGPLGGGAASFSGARVYHNTTQTLTNASDTTLAFNSERYDTATYHDTVTNNSRLTVPSNGYYHVGAALDVDPAAAWRGWLALRWHDTSVGSAKAIAVQSTFDNDATDPGRFLNVSADWQADSTDYFYVTMHQVSGANQTLQASDAYTCEFWIHKIG